MKSNPLSKLELVLIAAIIILSVVSISLFVVWRFLIPSVSIEDIANNQPTSTPAVEMMMNPTPTQLIDDSSDSELVPTQVVDHSNEIQPTPTQYIVSVVTESTTTEDTSDYKLTSPQPMWWWNDDHFYRQPLILKAETPITYDPTITQVVKLTLNTTDMYTEGKLRSDAKDLQVVYWDGVGWTNLPLYVQVEVEPSDSRMGRRIVPVENYTDTEKADISVQPAFTMTTIVHFPLRSNIAETSGDYWLYYGNLVPYPPPALLEEYIYAKRPYTESEGNKDDEEIFVDFDAEPVTGLAPFTITVFYGAYPEPNEYKWAFGDGESLSLPGRTDLLATQTFSAVTHTYKQPGVYTPTLTVITNTVSGPITTTHVSPGLIWVAGYDASDKITGTLGGNEETPVVTATLLANPTTSRVITSAEQILTVTFPPDALKETLVVSHVPYRAKYDQGGGTLARFEITAETLDGQPVEKLDQPMILTLNLNRYDLSDPRDKALANTIMFFGWDDAGEEWEPLISSTEFDHEQGIIVSELDRFSRPMMIYITGMP